MKLNFKYIIKVSMTILFLSQPILYAQKVSVPIEMQFQIIPKIISLDKNYQRKSISEETNLLILYSKQQRSSFQVYEEIVKNSKFQKITISGKESSILSFDISSQKDLENFVKKNRVKMLYITPLRGVDVSEITSICKQTSVLSITGVEDFINSNVSVILTMQENKLKININQRSAKEEGTDFSSRLLRMVNIL